MEYATLGILECATKIAQADLSINGSVKNSLHEWSELNKAITLFPMISLEEMTCVKLMNRIDIKYLVRASTIPVLIKKVTGDYCIQEINNRRVADYGTTYLDTRELNFYHSHMNGKLNHIKWRIRSYLESNLNFLEIKKKTNSGRTQKSRIVYDPSLGLNIGTTQKFIMESSGYEAVNLYPVLENNFNRITLINNDKTERLTIDFNILFKNGINGKSAFMQDLAIIEIKQDRSSTSAIRKYIDEMRIKKSGISKYCLGLAITTENLKSNLYKRKIRYINKIAKPE